jgi:biopolymer transport protein ExbB
MSFSLIAWWHGADGVVQTLLVLLLALSVVSWAVLFVKGREMIRLLRLETRVAQAFAVRAGVPVLAIYPRWVPSVRISGLLAELSLRTPGRDYLPLLSMQRGQLVRRERLALENGLVMLATIGSAAPFVGLLGTVWGIMHALHGLSGTTAVSLELVAGPVAEALLMTAVGLFTAIPALFGYNLLVRAVRRIMGLVDDNTMTWFSRALAVPSI